MYRLKWNLLLPALLLTVQGLSAAGTEAAQLQTAEEARAEYQAMLEEAERARQEAEAARAEALRAAVMARETARRSAELARQAAENQRMESEELRQMEAERRQEMEQAREELGRAHRELRAATREVARAHRELGRAGRQHKAIRHVNLGDRAVIGLVMGKETDAGIEIIGVSPDGPAERAGLKQGDVLVSLRGVDLTDGETSARRAVYRVMSDVGDGEELEAQVLRDGESWNFTITAERREPSVWQTMIRIPEVEVVEGLSGEYDVVVENIEVPEIDEEALLAEVEALTERLKSEEFMHILPGAEDFEHYEFDFEGFSDVGEHALNEASVWFGLPHSRGLELAAINEGLGAYFKTDKGVLVIKAAEDNSYDLKSGDVILAVGTTSVNSPSDMMRALRVLEPGSEIELSIKRNRRDQTLTVTVPDNRLGYRFMAGKKHH